MRKKFATFDATLAACLALLLLVVLDLAAVRIAASW
jgi:hypothetical protein